MGRDPDAAIVDRDRIGPGRGVVAEVVDRDRAAGGIQPAGPARAQLAKIERLEPAGADGLEGRRERPVADALTRPPGPAEGPVDAAGTRRRSRCVDSISGAVRSTASTNRLAAGKPSAASWMAGAMRSAGASRPYRAWASAQERTAPGTVMASGPRSGIDSWPARRRAAASAPAAARPDPLSATWRPAAASQISQNASPPRPQLWGATTPSTAFVAIAASTAEPPARRIARPAALARWWGATTAPWLPRAAGTGTHGRPSVTPAPARSGRPAPAWTAGVPGLATARAG